MNDQTVVILLAEDDPDDRYLISEAFDESSLPVRLFIVNDGEEMLDYLNHRGNYVDSKRWPLPALIVLDLNMPRKDGREVLAEIKTNSSLRRIPVVVLTTSQAEEDVVRAYDLGVSGFITKPVSFNTLLEIMKSLGNYWLNIVELPPAAAEG